MAPATRPRARGFTLVEVLIALFIMAIMAAMAWQGVDGISRARTMGQQRMEQTLRLDTVLTQWDQDLAAIQDTSAVVPPFAFDGATLRLVRRQPNGVQLVAWSLRNGEWLRWTSPVVTRTADLQEQWLRSQQLQGREAQQAHTLNGLNTWQLYCFRANDNAWSNCQSSSATSDSGSGGGSGDGSGGNPSTAANDPIPRGVRLLITFTGSPLQGNLTRDVIIPSRKTT